MKTLVSCLFLIISHFAFARPEYAAREKLNCMQCHVSPWGAGPRKISGKVYGSREYEGSVNNESDLYYADLRAVFFKDTEVPNRKKTNGLGLMTASVSGYVPVIKKDEGFDTKLLATYDFGAFGTGPREVYAIFENNDESTFSPTSVVFGKFYSPFGLLTDEHRTYTKFQTATTLREYEMGAVASFDPTEYLHLDLALTNGFGFKNTGGTFSSNDETFGVISNLRFNHADLPFMLGLSHAKHQTKAEDAPDPYAYSLYSVLTFDHLFGDEFRASLANELVFARHMNEQHNPRYIGNFIPNTADGTQYKSSVKDKTSRGFLAEFKWELTQNLILMYKFDHFILDTDYEGDAYLRHGFGFRYQFSANTNLLVRLEKAEVKVPTVKGTGIRSDQSNAFAVLRLWL